MKVHGMGVGFIHVEPEHAAEYNRWWDVTMGPENAALPELLASRRYYATVEERALRAPVEEGLEPERAHYCHMYLYGVEDLHAAQASMARLAKDLHKAGRGFGKGWSRYQGPHRLVGAHTRPGLVADPDSVPYMGHLAVHFSIGTVTDPDQIDATHAWYEEVHIPDILETPGFLAALRLLPIDPEERGRFMNVFLLDELPSKALPAFQARVPELSERGRLSPPGGAVRLLYAAPYRPLVPLQYDLLEDGGGG